MSSSGLFILSSDDSAWFVVDIALVPADEPEKFQPSESKRGVRVNSSLINRQTYRQTDHVRQNKQNRIIVSTAGVRSRETR
jgi:hypothetical protein